MPGASNIRQGTTPRKTFTKAAQSAVSLCSASCQLALKLEGPSGITWTSGPQEMDGEMRLEHEKRPSQGYTASYHQSGVRAEQTAPLLHHLKGIAKDPPNIILQSLVLVLQRGPDRNNCIVSWEDGRLLLPPGESEVQESTARSPVVARFYSSALLGAPHHFHRERANRRS